MFLFKCGRLLSSLRKGILHVAGYAGRIVGLSAGLVQCCNERCQPMKLYGSEQDSGFDIPCSGIGGISSAGSVTDRRHSTIVPPRQRVRSWRGTESRTMDFRQTGCLQKANPNSRLTTGARLQHVQVARKSSHHSRRENRSRWTGISSSELVRYRYNCKCRSAKCPNEMRSKSCSANQKTTQQGCSQPRLIAHRR